MIVIPATASCGTKGSMPGLFIETIGTTMAFYVFPEYAACSTESSGEAFNVEVTQNLLQLQSLEMTSPHNSLLVGGIGISSLPLQSMEAVGSADIMGMGEADVELLPLSASGSMALGFTGSGSIELPRLEISGNDTYQTGNGAPHLPVPEFSALGIHGVILEGDIQIRSPSMLAQMVSDAEGASQAIFPSLNLDGAIVSGQYISASLELPALRISGTFPAEQPGYGLLTFPALTADGSIGENGQGSGAIIFPALILNAIIESVLAYLGVEVGSMNLRLAAVCDYEQFPFNSYAAFGSYGLGAKEDGIYEFVGDRDGDLDMFSEFRKTHLDLSAFNHKRMTDAYFHIQSNGEYKIEIFADEVSSIHDVNDPGGGIHAWKVNLPRGIKGQGIGIGAKFFNTDFILDEVAMISEFTSRRNR